MRCTLPPSLLSLLSEFVAERTGLFFPLARWGDLERGVAAAAADFGCADGESCAHWLLSAPPTRRTDEMLARHLSVGETYFFRERPALDALRDRILPQLLHARRGEKRLRIWSAGCSTGEEAYTLAMLLDALVPDRSGWNITLLATDFNPAALRKAEQGVYGAWSFRDVPDSLRDRYFIRRGGDRFEILPRIRDMVSFSYLNLAEDAPAFPGDGAGAMDVILCRNVLMYFSPARMQQVVERFRRSLAGDGWMIASPVEASNALFSSFAPVEFPGVVLYRKTEADKKPEDGAAFRWMLPPPSGTAFQVAAEEPENVAAGPPQPPVLAPVAVGVPAPQAAGREATAMSAQRVRVCANRGRLDEALAGCERMIEADKMNPAHHYLLAAILQDQGRGEEAVAALMRVLYLEPGHVAAHFALGNACQSLGRHRQAQRHFDNVLLLLRQYPEDRVLEDADGLTAGRLAGIVSTLRAALPAAV